MSERFDILETTIPGVKVVQRRPIQDTRGFFERMFCASEMSALTNSRPVLQVNRTRTLRAGAVRGMHFQHPPHCECKFVACVRGEVYDVAVDIRRGSKTFLQWHAELLTDSNFKTLFIPEGFAHGFQSLTSDCELLYLHTARYETAAEGALNARDPMLGIRWPMLISEMSERDRQHPLLSSAYEGVDS